LDGSASRDVPLAYRVEMSQPPLDIGESVEVMPVSEHEAALAERDAEIARLRSGAGMTTVGDYPTWDDVEDRNALAARVEELTRERDELDASCQQWHERAIRYANGNVLLVDECEMRRLVLKRERERLERLERAVRAWDATLSEFCDGPERDAVRAALAAARTDEPERADT
jgi:hypothetical protein